MGHENEKQAAPKYRTTPSWAQCGNYYCEEHSCVNSSVFPFLTETDKLSDRNGCGCSTEYSQPFPNGVCFFPCHPHINPSCKPDTPGYRPSMQSRRCILWPHTTHHLGSSRSRTWVRPFLPE